MTIAGFDISLPYLVLGALTGLSYGLLAVGLVLVYRSSRFINFAHIGTGVLAAAIGAIGITRFDVPWVLGFAGAIAIGAAIAAGIDRFIVRELEGTPKVLPMVATLGVGSALLLVTVSINDTSSGEYPQPDFLPTFDLGPLFISSANTALALLGPIVVIGLAIFFRRTRYGLAVRAAASRPDAAATSGIPPAAMSTLSWSLAGGIAAFSAFLVLPGQGSVTPDLLGPGLLFRGLAAAAIAGFASLPTAMLAGIGIGITEQVIRTGSGTAGYVEILLFALILLGIALRASRIGARTVGEPWTGVSLMRDLPPSYRSVWLIRNLGWVAGAIAVVLALGIPAFSSNRGAFITITVMCFAIVGLSVGLLTGYGGQVSLGQFAYGGVAAAVSVAVVDETGVFLAGVAAGAAVAAGLSALVGWPAVRVPGLFLAVATLGFALVVSSWLLRQPWMLGDGVAPQQPIIGPFVVDSPRAYFYVVLAGLVVSTVVVRLIRSSRFGRATIALRDNEPAARALGIRSVRRKLALYAVAGAIAGLGGALFGHAQSRLSAAVFPVDASIDVVIATVIGGLDALNGALIGSVYLVGVPRWFEVGVEGLAALAAVWLVVVINEPRGVVGALIGVRDRLDDAIARRAGIDPAVARSGPSAEAAPAQPPPPSVRASGAEGTVLEVRGLTKHYGGTVAVDDVTFSVHRGETVGLIGPNGAGKTTVFEMVSGFVRPGGGSIVLDGVDVTGDAPEAIARAGLARSFQGGRVFPTMTVRQALRTSTEHTPHPVRPEPLAELLGLGPYLDERIGALSTGTVRLVEVACLASTGAHVLLLDEPSAGIAHAGTDQLAGALEHLRSDLGLTIVVIDHDLGLLARLSDRLVALEAGRVVATGPPDAVASDPRVAAGYLGSRAGS